MATNEADKRNEVDTERAVRCEVKKTEEANRPKTADTAGSQLNTPVEPFHAPLTLIVKNLASPQASVIVGVYGLQNKFLNENDQLRRYKFKPADSSLLVQINDLGYGQLALAIYQDLNEDDKINRNIIGIPVEPYAFSNNYKPIIRPPVFKDCSFAYNDTDNTVVISLIR